MFRMTKNVQDDKKGNIPIAIGNTMTQRKKMRRM
jgi:hypothetical protein